MCAHWEKTKTNIKSLYLIPHFLFNFFLLYFLPPYISSFCLSYSLIASLSLSHINLYFLPMKYTCNYTPSFKYQTLFFIPKVQLESKHQKCIIIGWKKNRVGVKFSEKNILMITSLTRNTLLLEKIQM